MLWLHRCWCSVLHRLSELAMCQVVHQLWSDIALPAGKPILAVGQSIRRIAAVDCNACRMRVLPGGLRHVVLPVPGGNAGCVFRLCSQIGVCHQIQVQRFAGRTILVLAGELHITAATVQVAIAGLVIAHASAIHQFGQFFRLPAQGIQTCLLQGFGTLTQCGAHLRTYL